MKQINIKETKRFWEGRSKQYGKASLGTLTLFSDHPDYINYIHKTEIWHLKKILKLRNKPKVLDLGCGVGREDFEIVSNCSKIIGLDYSKGLIKIARKEAKKKRIRNIEFKVADIIKIKPFGKFDVVIITGTLIYLTDKQINSVMKLINASLNKGGAVLSRELTAVKQRFSRVNEYDQKFGCRYNATYRTMGHYFEIFEKNGMKNMYWNYLFCPLNFGMKIYEKFRYVKSMQWLIKMGFKTQILIDRLLFSKKQKFKKYVKNNYKKTQIVYLYKK